MLKGPVKHPDNQYNRKEGKYNVHHHHRGRIRNLLLILNPRLIQSLRKIIISHHSGKIFLAYSLSLFFLCRNRNPIAGDNHLFHLVLLNHFQKFVVGDLLRR